LGVCFSGVRTHHDVAGVQVRARERDQDEADGEEAGGDGLDQARRVLLVPGRGVGGEGDGASEAEERAREHAVPPELVQAGFGLFLADAGEELHGLFDSTVRNGRSRPLNGCEWKLA